MKFLLDNNLSPTLADFLRGDGHVVEHVRQLGLGAAPDVEVMAHAREHDQVLISADTDFGTLLARSGHTKPSIILIRRSTARRAHEIAGLLKANLDQVENELTFGAVVVIGDYDLRVRRLPIPPGASH